MPNYKQQLSAFYKKSLTRYEVFNLGLPSSQLQKYGMSNLNIIMTQGTMTKSTRKSKKNKTGHNISRQTMKNLKDYITNPEIIIKNPDKDAFILVIPKKDENGNPIVIAVHNNQKHNSVNVNEIKSIYGRTDFDTYCKREAEKGNILFINNKQQKSR